MRTLRTALAVLSVSVLTALFLDFTGTLHPYLGFMARIQFLPALLALNVGVVVVLVVVTLLFGRVYCSVMCPLGILQDVFARFARIGGKKRRRKRRSRFSFSPEKRWLRYGVLALTVVAFIAGMGSVVALLDPYGAFGRIVSNLLSPLYLYGNNWMAAWAEAHESYAFYSINIWMRAWATLVVAAATVVALFVLAFRSGRTYCNTICPVGTLLGLLSRFALFRIRIDEEKCVSCGLCARQCKASCIDSKNHWVDASRCIACFDCLSSCSKGALSFARKTRRHDKAPESHSIRRVDSGRRAFLGISAILASTIAAKAQEKAVDGGLAAIVDKTPPRRTVRIVPPGAGGVKDFASRCTGCQLCVSVCPNYVLRPSLALASFMQPEMQYERGYCRPECTKCSEVCPAGAIRLIDRAEKSSIQIGHAEWQREACLVVTDNVSCGNCARHCPVGAITMIPLYADNSGGSQVPSVDKERCIGCGACENLCPVRPVSAIHVEGHERHRMV